METPNLTWKLDIDWNQKIVTVSYDLFKLVYSINGVDDLVSASEWLDNPRVKEPLQIGEAVGLTFVLKRRGFHYTVGLYDKENEIMRYRLLQSDRKSLASLYATRDNNS